ncbi:Glycosyl transferase, family 4, conserved region-containing protein [Caldalkalibacillus thermarum TA2.A1]|uniref:Glycosyl transferase, family 4, conserved region-containing protein n=1 Tax=Caldalkalibacillus thermarum (strain TA2.A1) TaxID=986075 RepID=F5L9A2_CALTT|nr:MraY family glycosyltransferase [Caldalkalibacillus thermarum]EGL82044.1 Glycosyl transferase, family 4, conserved region-containing protein [Caldalkalibacillus thermarum TA2.A1]QZT34038.1 undecaprenyl/decaprenyl-phosphate alpha-N-acetylglucosaminyl 1-phosphate transferase [Caldalkalibacillus thermarum TA2.A1]
MLLEFVDHFINNKLYIASFLLSFFVTLLSTPLVKKMAFKVGALDYPNNRKVHQEIMPRLGGLAIYLGFFVSCIVFIPMTKLSVGLILGGIIIVILGIIDDIYNLTPKIKLIGQIIAAITLVFFGFQVQFINLPFDGTWILGWLAIPITILWIVGVTNSVNLIDGLDGLAAGVSAIATTVIMIIAFMMGNDFVLLYCAILLGAILSFLIFNFYPAKIFMGDTGALFLGFNLAALSILGFKQVTVVSFIIPILVLGVPLSDTFFAIIRRILSHKPISSADKNHLHHCLLRMGLSHRASVLVIYGISVMFGLCAILLSQSALWLGIIVLCILALGLQLGAEMIGLINIKEKPMLSLIKKLRYHFGNALRSKPQ